MQPMLALTAEEAGLLYINGHFAGELSEDMPLLRPVHPRGPLYLEFRPFSDAFRPMTRRLVFSGGTPMPESAESAAGLNVIIWPGNTVEIEFSPEYRDVPRQVFTRNGKGFVLECGAEPKLFCEGKLFSPLPPGAQIPEAHSLPNGNILLGSCRDGMYLAAADREFHRSTGFLRAKEIHIDGERIRALVVPGDLMGRAVRETWLLLPEGLQLVSSENSWADGMSRRPQSPEDTAIAAVENALMGFDDESAALLTPRLRQQHPLDGIRDKCDLCVRMKYAPPGARPAVGLLALEGDRLGRVQPLYFRAVPSAGESAWQIDSMEYAGDSVP